MTPLQAIDLFVTRRKPSWWPFLANEGSWDEQLLLVAAGCSLSGMLDDAVTIDDLHSAFTHFHSLMTSEILTADDWSSEAESIDADLQAWGDSIQDQLNAISRSN